MNDLHQAFMIGAKRLAYANSGEYGPLHRANGISPEEWKTLNQAEYWTPEQTREIRSILANVMEACLTLSGMPAVALPGQYAAACISQCVAPANRLVACMKAPETFDAIQASGILGTFEVRPMRPEQLMALVMAYSADYRGEPPAQKLPRETRQTKNKEVQQ